MLDERKLVPAVAEFYERHERWPAAVTNSDHERSLGLWLNRQRVDLASGTMDAFRRAALDQYLPGWASDPDGIWHERAREASDFLLSNRYIPSVKSARYNERMVAIWLLTQQSLQRTGGLRNDRLLWLELHCPGWARTPVSTLTKKSAGAVGSYNA